MNSTQVLLVIIGMSVATFLPRLLPVFILDKLSLSPVFQKWLKCIPYAALGALIFPGVLSVDPAHMWVGLIGAVCACLLAFFRLHILYTILGSILCVWLVQSLI